MGQKSHYWMARRVFETLGVELELKSNSIFLPADRKLKVTREEGGAIPCIDDGPWPQFPSDMMSCMIVLATQVEGANAVVCDPHRVVVVGPAQLRAMPVSSPDIRAGMALIGAALCAEGVSEVNNIQMIDRGCERIEEKLQSLGARVKRITG